jgi:SNF family Na+-dependent transporter
MYVTATSPYLFMLALLIRNSLLEGAKDGVIFYLKPDMEKIFNIQVMLSIYFLESWK